VMVRDMLPPGIRGLVAGGLLAALMSSLASCFNSSSTLFTMDIYKKLRPKSSEPELVWVGRVATAVIVFLGLLWIPFIMGISPSLYGYLQSVQAYIAPPIFAVFFLGVFVKRINGPGCMTGLIGGFLLGMARLVAELYRSKLAAGSPLRWFAEVNFLYFCLLLTAVSALLIVAVSLCTARPREEKLKGLTFATLSDEDRRLTRASWSRWDVIATAGVLVMILATYAYFNG
jgi:SSS family solute:Na+ symporter